MLEQMFCVEVNAHTSMVVDGHDHHLHSYSKTVFTRNFERVQRMMRENNLSRAYYARDLGPWDDDDSGPMVPHYQVAECTWWYCDNVMDIGQSPYDENHHDDCCGHLDSTMIWDAVDVYHTCATPDGVRDVEPWRNPCNLPEARRRTPRRTRLAS